MHHLEDAHIPSEAFCCLANADGNDCSDAIYHCSPKFLGRVTAGRLHHCSVFFGSFGLYQAFRHHFVKSSAGGDLFT